MFITQENITETNKSPQTPYTWSTSYWGKWIYYNKLQDRPYKWECVTVREIQ